jgi:putative ABC transport system permease protein
MKTTLGGSLERSSRADFFVSGSLDPTVLPAVCSLSEVDTAAGFRHNEAVIDGDTRQVWGADFAALPSLVDLGLSSSLDPLARGVLLRDHVAQDLGVAPGDSISVAFDRTGPVTLEVVGVYDNPSVLGDHIVDLGTYGEVTSDDTDDLIMATAASGVPLASARAAVNGVVGTMPSVEFWDEDEYRLARESEVAGLLTVVDLLLGLAVGVAFLGVVNTLSLSVLERTREFGLLSVIGMTRSQLHRMVTGEGLLVCLLGAGVGVVFGLGLGVAVGAAMPEDLVDGYVVPWGRLASLVGVGGTLGVAAALGPAWRAGKMEPLSERG